MAFSINPAFTHIPIEEPHLHEVFRSISACVVKMTGGRSCEAFICTSRKNGRYAVFVSLLDTVTRIIHVMTPDEQDVSPDAYRALLGEAKTLLTDLGFELEKVNIEFSAAIREVVIRDIRVMHPPPRNRMRISRGQNRHTAEETPPGNAAPASAAAGSAVAAAVTAAAAVTVAAEKAAPAAPDVAALRDEICRLRRDGLHLEKVVKRATAEVEKLRAAKTQADAELLEVRDALLRETVVSSRVSAEAAAAAEALTARIGLLEEELARAASDEGKEAVPDAEIEWLKAEMESLVTRHRVELVRFEADRREAVDKLEILQRKFDELQEAHRAEVEAAERAAETIRTLEEELAAAQREPDAPPVAVDTTEIERLEAELNVLSFRMQEECDRLEVERVAAFAEAETLRRELMELQEKYLEDATAMRTLEEEADLARAAAASEKDRLLRRHEDEHEEQRALVAVRDEEIRALKEELIRAQGEASVKAEQSSGAVAAAEAARLAAEGEAARLQEEVRRLREEKEGELLAASVEVELLRRKGQEAEQTLVQLQEEHRRLTVERPTLLAAARKAKRLQTEIQRLRTEHADREAAFAGEMEQKVAAPTIPAVAAVSGEAPVQREAAFAIRETVSVQRQEVPAFEPVMAAVAGPVPDHDLLEEHDMADSLAQLLADGAGYAPATFGSSAVEFRIDSRLHDVEYESDDDIIAVYEAMNNVQAMPDGRGLKKCGAYICVVRHDGTPQVYNVWVLVDQSTALVAVPDRQGGEDGAESVLKDALFYFESVGFIMEPLDLGNSRQKRSRALSRISVLRKNEAAAGTMASAREHVHASR